MTKPEARAILRRLSRAFLVPAPDLIWSLRARRGRGGPRKIKIGPHCYRGTENTLCHEFAHYLTGYRWHHSPEEVTKPRPTPHGPVFYQNLIAITQEHFGHPNLYAWSTEYRALAQRARKDGWLSVQPAHRMAAEPAQPKEDTDNAEENK